MNTSHISKKRIPKGEEIKGHDLREGIFNLITIDYPNFEKESCITLDELNKYRRLYLTSLILDEKGEPEVITTEVLDAIKNNSTLSASLQGGIETKPALGQAIADKISAFGGSWAFIITFLIFIIAWIAVNIWLFTKRPFDPYPFILLSLLLSCLPAIQAPIIMMSQKRQEQKDRQRGELDYKINLKAELEIKLLHEKLDHLLVHQNKKLLEIQEVQIDYLEDLMKRTVLPPNKNSDDTN